MSKELPSPADMVFNYTFDRTVAAFVQANQGEKEFFLNGIVYTVHATLKTLEVANVAHDAPKDEQLLAIADKVARRHGLTLTAVDGKLINQSLDKAA